MKKITFVDKSSIVYPYVSYTKDNDICISDSDLIEVILYAENYGMH